MKVLHLSTWQEVCGIAEYTKNLVKALDQIGIENEIYPIPRRDMKYMSLEEISSYFRAFCQKAKDFDAVHIQHEHAFFNGSYSFRKSIKVFNEVLRNLRRSKVKRIIVTFHTEPIFDTKPILETDGEGASPISLLRRTVDRGKSRFFSWRWEKKVAPFFQPKYHHKFHAIVHSKKTRLVMIQKGFSPDSISVIEHGFPAKKEKPSPEEQLRAKKDLGIPEQAKVLTIFGFLSSYKGYDVAIKALAKLPEDYFLVIAGGTHPEAPNRDLALEEILACIESVGNDVKRRILVTGYLPFEKLRTVHSATDICLAPYHPTRLSASGALSWALSSGKPTIASNIPAFHELNEDANCLVLFQPMAHLELAMKITAVIEDKPLQAELEQRATDYIERYSWLETARRISDHYKP